MRKNLMAMSAATLLAVVPIASPAATVVLQTLLDPPGTTLNLNPADNYTGGGNIDRNLIIEGNNALVDLDAASGIAPLELKIRSGRTVEIRNLRFRDGSEFFSIIVEQGATLIMTNCEVSNAVRAVVARDSSTLTITGGSYQGSLFATEVRNGSTATITGAAMSGSGTAHVSAENNSALTVRDCTFSGAPASVLSAQSSSLLAEDLRISGIATAQTIRVFGTAPTLTARDLELINHGGKAFDITNAPVVLENVLITTGPSANSSVNASNNSGNIGFVFNSPGSITMTGMNFRGIHTVANILDPSGALTFSGNTMTNVRKGWNIVRPSSTANITNLTANGVVENTVRLENASAVMENLTMANCLGIVLDLIQNSHLTIRNSTFTDCATQQFNTVINGTDSTIILDGGVSVTKPSNTQVIAGATKVTRGHLEIRANNFISGYSLGAHYLTNCTGHIFGSRFENNGEGVYVDASNVTVEDNVINDNIIGQALQSEGFCNIIFRRNEVYASVESGNGINSSGTILIEDNYYQDVQFGGISISPEATSPVARVRRNTTRNAGNPGGAFVSGSGADIRLNAFLRCTAYGLHDTGDNNTFDRNFILAPLENHANMAVASTQRLRYNYFDGGQKGILFTSGQPTIVGNHSINVGMPGGADFAFFFAPGGTRPADFTNNTVTSASGHGIWVSDGPPAPAQNNYWGAPTGPRLDIIFFGTGAVAHNVLTDPFLTEPSVAAGFQDHPNFPANTERVSELGNSGITMITTATTLIPDVTVSAWATRSNQTDSNTASVLPDGDARIYVTALNDARLTIRGGTSRLRVGAERLAWAGVQVGSYIGWYHNEESNTWQSIAVNSVAGGAEIVMPTHAGTFMIANGENPFIEIVCRLLGDDCQSMDLNGDGVIDAADASRLALMN